MNMISTKVAVLNECYKLNSLYHENGPCTGLKWANCTMQLRWTKREHYRFRILNSIAFRRN